VEQFIIIEGIIEIKGSVEGLVNEKVLEKTKLVQDAVKAGS
jgi:hypothetical protein